jgi:hypothetical protein
MWLCLPLQAGAVLKGAEQIACTQDFELSHNLHWVLCYISPVMSIRCIYASWLVFFHFFFFSVCRSDTASHQKKKSLSCTCHSQFLKYMHHALCLMLYKSYCSIFGAPTISKGPWDLKVHKANGRKLAHTHDTHNLENPHHKQWLRLTK